MIGFEYHKPQSLEEIWELKEKLPGAFFIAGGTDIMVQVRNKEVQPQALLSLRSISDLEKIEMGEITHIGAMTTITSLLQNPELRQAFPFLIEAAKKLGSVQIRNLATIGGNLCNCSPCADMALPLLVLEAKVRLQNPQQIREIPINKFFLGPGESCLGANEILTDILLKIPGPKVKAVFLKKGRVKMDLAVASVAILLEINGNICQKARLAAGSVAPVPLRLQAVERLLEHTPLSKNLIAEAQELASESVCPITDVRATGGYRRHIVGVLVKRGLEMLLGWDKA